MPTTPLPDLPARRATARDLLPAALVAAAALVGVLAGFGVRGRETLRAFSSAGLRLRGLPEFLTPDRGLGLDALLGIAHATALGLAWGLLATFVAARARRWGAWAMALAVAVVVALVLLLDPRLPTPLRLAAGAIGGAERAVCAVAIAIVGAVAGTSAAVRAGAASSAASRAATTRHAALGEPALRVAPPPRGSDEARAAPDPRLDEPS